MRGSSAAEPDLLLVTVVVRRALRRLDRRRGRGLRRRAARRRDDARHARDDLASLLTLAGYWAGRYGETTGRGRRYAPALAAFAISILVGLGAVALHFLLGEAVAARDALVTAVPSAILAAVLALGVIRLTGAMLVPPPQGLERARQVELV